MDIEYVVLCIILNGILSFSQKLVAFIIVCSRLFIFLENFYIYIYMIFTENFADLVK